MNLVSQCPWHACLLLPHARTIRSSGSQNALSFYVLQYTFDLFVFKLGVSVLQVLKIL